MIALLVCIVLACHSFTMQSNHAPHQEKVILYTFYTPSHAVLLEQWFLPSLQDTFDVVIKKFEQDCPSGTYMEEGWTQTMLRKIDLILDALITHAGDIIIYADIDIQFFQPIEDKIRISLQAHDLVFQRDNCYGAVCAGFMAMRASNATISFFSRVRDEMVKNPGQSDQPTINKLLLRDNYAHIAWDYLPISFFGTGTVSFIHFANQKTWQEGDIVIMPDNIVLHHANYTSSVENKIKLLTWVKNNHGHPVSIDSEREKRRKADRKKRLAQRRNLKKNTVIHLDEHP